MLFGFIFINCISLRAQLNYVPTDLDKSALEGIIVEKYYIADSKDSKNKEGGSLPKGSVTYRIYVDLKPGYNMQAVYGGRIHDLRIETTTEFFNNTYSGETTGDQIDSKKINENTVALDSWVTIGAATNSHFGILKSDDKDGSIIKRKGLDEADGLIAGKISPVTYYGLDLGFFQKTEKASLFSSNDGSWVIFGGMKGPTEANRILIAQLTTDGKLSYELNIQVGNPTGDSFQFVAKNPEGTEIQFDGLMLKK